jgi:3-dehydroquinate synthase
MGAMTKKNIQFSTASTTFYFDASFDYFEKLTSKDSTVIITDENVFNKNQKKFKDWKTIVISAGEQYKHQQTVDSIIEQLITYGADRKSFVVGVGGGVVTDIAGYVAAIFLRGVKFGFVPTSILAMVDAAIGGKNGIDVGVYKNMVGLIRQPSFLLYDYSFLKSLPNEEWINGFAEIIKHACIKDAAMFKLLEEHKLKDFQKDNELLNNLIQRNALIKSKVVQQDEFEQGDRKLLNYGHTLGHAIENTYQLPHGHAVTIGMVVAAHLSESLIGFKDSKRVASLIEQYGLPAHFNFDPAKAIEVMQADKKRVKDIINYILLEKIGKGIVKPLKVEAMKPVLIKLSN